jgi:hypothetical protein
MIGPAALGVMKSMPWLCQRVLLAQFFGIDPVIGSRRRQVVPGNVQASESKPVYGVQQKFRICTARMDQKIHVGRIPGISMPGNRQRSNNELLNSVRV